MATGATLVFLIAVVAARFINWGVYTWAYFARKLGPWAPAPEGCQRNWQDHLPVVGWFLLRREFGKSDVHTKGFWIRPLLIEAVFPLLVTGYYCAYTAGWMFPAVYQTLPGFPDAARTQQLQWQFSGHFILFVLMTIATFIDFDEHSIPDYVTIPGAIIGVMGAAFADAWLPFSPVLPPPGALELDAALPVVWPPIFNGIAGLWIGLGILSLWGFALLERRWITRRGYKKAFEYFFAKLFRRKSIWLTVLVSMLLMMGVTVYVYCNDNPGRWTYLLSSLLGMAFAAGITWGVRISASVGLGVEALGFGDVTLMAMIGTYIGWQPSLLVFFMAPLIAILFVLVRWAITGDPLTPYGPYLCAATVAVLVFWNEIWFGWAAPLFVIGPDMIVGIVAACVALMGVMLWIWRLIKQALGFAH